MNPLWDKYREEMLEYIKPEHYERLQRLWSQPHRFYHNETHLADILNSIETEKEKLTATNRVYYMLAAFYHDAYYSPTRLDNEKLCVELWKRDSMEIRYTHTNFFNEVKTLILATEQHSSRDPFIKKFLDYDSRIALNGTDEEIFEWERGIFKEYQFVAYPVYKKQRLDFLNRWKHIHPEAEYVVNVLTAYLTWWKPRVGVFVGSFNPYHIGHEDVRLQAEKIFDKVIVAKGKNPDKVSTPVKATKSKKVVVVTEPVKAEDPIDRVLPYTETREFSGFQNELVEQLENEGVDVTIIRSFRADEDIPFEVAQNRLVKKLGDVKSVFFLSNPGNEFISSTAIRAIKKVPTGNTEWSDKKDALLAEMIPSTFDYAWKDLFTL